ncbi:hypothetical protein [Saccharothrix syringae]|uniref:Uncharacterized protein n=1 Tax=Saccharothrix syringae TaxID=103733 RepID=A0A5Q0GYD7_SACSY|nr:hypothetical protein [Saccharothrix syringae]QFZ18514.1 hypothetical protein EKG83_14465 [Saccharothrix syringae]
MPVARGWAQPLLPEGPLRTLNEELHALHARSGYLSSRNIAERIAERPGLRPISHTTVRKTLTDPGLPRLSHVMAVICSSFDGVCGVVHVFQS